MEATKKTEDCNSFALAIVPCTLAFLLIAAFLGYFAFDVRNETCWIVKVSNESVVADGLTWSEIKEKAMKDDYNTSDWFVELDSSE